MEYGNWALSNDSSAYEIPFVEKVPQRKKENKVVIKKKHKQKLNKRVIIYSVVISLSAYFMLAKQVAVYETKAKIASLTQELEALKAEEVQKNFELEQEVDLATIEEIATSKLNMQRPDKSQKVYLNVPGDDVTEVTAGDTEGFKNKFSKSIKKLNKNIIGIFTLN